jgi:hypothetical protein
MNHPDHDDGDAEELRKVLVSESQKVKQMASDWVMEMELVLQKATALVKARQQNC